MPVTLAQLEQLARGAAVPLEQKGAVGPGDAEVAAVATRADADVLQAAHNALPGTVAALKLGEQLCTALATRKATKALRLAFLAKLKAL